MGDDRDLPEMARLPPSKAAGRRAHGDLHPAQDRGRPVSHRAGVPPQGGHRVFLCRPGPADVAHLLWALPPPPPQHVLPLPAGRGLRSSGRLCLVHACSRVGAPPLSGASSGFWASTASSLAPNGPSTPALL